MKLNYSYLSINDNYYSGYAQIPKIIEHIDKNNQNCEMTTENIRHLCISSSPLLEIVHQF